MLHTCSTCEDNPPSLSLSFAPLPGHLTDTPLDTAKLLLHHRNGGTTTPGLLHKDLPAAQSLQHANHPIEARLCIAVLLMIWEQLTST